MIVKCPFCHKEVDIPNNETLPGLNISECPECKKGIVWVNKEVKT
jgi:endogenous inhibitor of DNA gyrase (YacG/DUF329 family)